MSFAPREYLRHIADEAAYLEQATSISISITFGM
jgi:hypothetical protein